MRRGEHARQLAVVEAIGRAVVVGDALLGRHRRAQPLARRVEDGPAAMRRGSGTARLHLRRHVDIDDKSVSGFCRRNVSRMDRGMLALSPAAFDNRAGWAGGSQRDRPGDWFLAFALLIVAPTTAAAPASVYQPRLKPYDALAQGVDGDAAINRWAAASTARGRNDHHAGPSPARGEGDVPVQDALTMIRS
jgi:hypothetical protein